MKSKYLLPPILALALFSGTVLACWLTPALTGGGVFANDVDLPSKVGKRWGRSGEMSEMERKLLPADTRMVRRTYLSMSPDSVPANVDCTIVMSGADPRSIHRPEVCLVGQGWTIIGNQIVEIPDGAGKLRIRDLTLSRTVTNEKGESANLQGHYFYWFAGDGVRTPSHFERILITTWDNIVHLRNHRWAYPSIFAMVNPEGGPVTGEMDAAVRAGLIQFVTELLPDLEKELAKTDSTPANQDHANQL